MNLLERVGNTRHSKINKVWFGKTVACIATGPSLTAAQIDMVRGLPLVACNDGYLIAPHAEVVYFADAKWYAWHKALPEFVAFSGQKCSIESGGNQGIGEDVHILKNAGGDGLSEDPLSIRTGSNSGHQIINIAALSGASTILLLGFDCKRAKDGKKHYFGDHPDKSEPPYDAIRTRFNAAANDAKRLGIEILNCTPGSALSAFPLADLAESLQFNQESALVSG